MKAAMKTAMMKKRVQTMNRWLQLSDYSAGDKAVRLDIFDQIGEKTEFWTGEKKGIAAAHFSNVLQALPSDTSTIELHINSPGGSLLDAFQIYNELKRHPATVDVIIDGQAASAASIIAMAGDTVTMPENATMWIHNPVTGFMNFFSGGADEARKQAKKLEALAGDLSVFSEKIVNTYLSKAGDKVTAEKLRAMMDDETLITAEHAVELGLADGVENAVEISNMAPADQSVREMMAAAAAQLEAMPAPATPAPAVQQAPSTPAAPAFASPEFAISACRDAQLQEMALYCIEGRLSETEVRQVLADAGSVKSQLSAAGLDVPVSDIADALKDGPLALFNFGLQQGLDAGSDNEGSELPGAFSMRNAGGSKPSVTPLSPNEIYKKRREVK
jgi:ATP-dependent Clp protease protease subunit